MGDLVNLRRARKDRARTEADRKAQANRISFGRTKTEKSLTRAEQDIAQRRIDGHRLDRALDEQD